MSSLVLSVLAIVLITYCYYVNCYSFVVEAMSCGDIHGITAITVAVILGLIWHVDPADGHDGMYA